MDAPRPLRPTVRPHRGYAGPLCAPEPITSEDSIELPPVERAGAYSRATWTQMINDFAWDGKHNLATWRRVVDDISHAAVDTHHLLRTHDLSSQAACWQAKTMGRIMGYRLRLEEQRHGRTPDGLRAAIQDTWFPAKTRLLRAAESIGSIASVSDASTRLACDRNDHITGAFLEAVVPHHQQWDAKRQRDMRQMFADREVVWAVAVGMPTDAPWTERSLLLAINTGLQPAGGRVQRSGPYSLTGGIPGGTGFADSRPSGITWSAADAMWAMVRGETGPFHTRKRLVADVQTAHRLAMQALVPSWATDAAPEPERSAERQAWRQINDHATIQDVDPSVTTWMFEQNYLKRCLADTQQDTEVLSVTDAGMARLKQTRMTS